MEKPYKYKRGKPDWAGMDAGCISERIKVKELEEHLQQGRENVLSDK